MWRGPLTPGGGLPAPRRGRTPGLQDVVKAKPAEGDPIQASCDRRELAFQCLPALIGRAEVLADLAPRVPCSGQAGEREVVDEREQLGPLVMESPVGDRDLDAPGSHQDAPGSPHMPGGVPRLWKALEILDRQFPEVVFGAIAPSATDTSGATVTMAATVEARS